MDDIVVFVAGTLPLPNGDGDVVCPKPFDGVRVEALVVPVPNADAVFVGNALVVVVVAPPNADADPNGDAVADICDPPPNGFEPAPDWPKGVVVVC